MADTLTITLDQRSAGNQQLGASSFDAITGSINLTSYSQTKTPIFGTYFRNNTTIRAFADAISSNGYLLLWDATAGAFRAYTGVLPTITEASNTTNIGTFNFVAIGKGP